MITLSKYGLYMLPVEDVAEVIAYVKDMLSTLSRRKYYWTELPKVLKRGYKDDRRAK